MKQFNRIQEHEKICDELHMIHVNKNEDYGDSFSKTFDLLGPISALTRITDKYNRLIELCTKPESERKVKDETIHDTLLDLANYCIMTEVKLREQENLNEALAYTE